MPISEPEWESIRRLIEKIVPNIAGDRRSYFVTGKVIKNDEKRNLIWLAEFGDQPIPIVGFEMEVKTYDEYSGGLVNPAVGALLPSKTRKRVQKVEIKVPRVGQTVLVARELGKSRLPRCLGVILGTGWIVAEEDDSIEL